MSNRRQTMRTYVILNITNPKTIYEEDFIPWDSRTDEELKQAAIDRKKELEGIYIDEKFKLILREEFEEDVEE